MILSGLPSLTKLADIFLLVTLGVAVLWILAVLAYLFTGGEK